MRAVRETGRALSTARAGWVPPIPGISPQPPTPNPPPSPDASTAARGRRHGGAAGHPRASSRVPGLGRGRGSGPLPRGRPRGCGPPAESRGRELLAAPHGPRRAPPPPPPPPRRPAGVRLGLPFLRLVAPQARPPRRRWPPLTILQMEAMFRTVISLKVAAIPHRHLYKVKTGLSMVECSRGGRAAGRRRLRGGGLGSG